MEGAEIGGVEVGTDMGLGIGFAVISVLQVELGLRFQRIRSIDPRYRCPYVLENLPIDGRVQVSDTE